MFDADDLRDEVEGLFAEQQGAHGEDVAAELFTSAGQETHNHGFRVFHPNPPNTPERKVAMRACEKRLRIEDIRRRLLAGERPKSTPGKRGRPPTLWYKVAAAMGLALTPPAASPRSEGSTSAAPGSARPIA